MQTKEEAYKELGNRAMMKYCEEYWSEVLAMLSIEQQHEYHWLVDGSCTSSEVTCTMCPQLKADWEERGNQMLFEMNNRILNRNDEY